MNGYFDAMGVSMLNGQSWRSITASIPGHTPLALNRFVYCGLRDVSDKQRQRVKDAGMDVIWGDTSGQKTVNFAHDLQAVLDRRAAEFTNKPTLVHLDLDVLDESHGKVNGYESPGGIHEPDLLECMKLIPFKTAPTSLTVCSFNPNQGDGSDGDKIADIGVRAVGQFVESLIVARQLVPNI
jgi:arginase